MRHAEVVGPDSRHLALHREWLCAGAVVTIALAVSALVLLRIANQGRPVDTWWLVSAIIAVGLGAVGLILTAKVPSNIIGWLFLAGGLSEAVMGLGREWAVYVELGGHHLPGASLAGWLGTLPLVPATATSGMRASSPGANTFAMIASPTARPLP